MFKSNFIPKPTKFQPAPELPQGAQLPHELERAGCPWLDRYVEFSDRWSPRSFDGYHEAIGLWILSTVAARRVSVIFGGERFTNLYILLVGRTSLHAKTTAAKIGKKLLSDIELDFLLLPDECTPQRMLVEMASKLPENWEELKAEQKEQYRKTLAFAGQKGWYYDEFGLNIQNMMKRDGPYSEFRGLLRKFDDNELTYERGTISRGRETVHRPYLSLLGALTPSDLASVAYAGSTLWGDGYLARMGLVVPPSGLIKEGRFPNGERVFPSELTEPILRWHERLGIPTANIVEGQLLPATDSVVSKIELSELVRETYYTYDDALRKSLNQIDTPDFDGNYARFPEKALRIAALFASLEGLCIVELHHWAKAQRIAERWRSNLHSLYKQVNESGLQQKEFTDEQKVLKAIKEKGSPTSREIQQFTGINNRQIANILDGLLTTKRVVAEEVGKTHRYKISSSGTRTNQSKPSSVEHIDQHFEVSAEQLEEQQEAPLYEWQELPLEQ